ncbi:chaC-like protein [Hirsutella rhossiliensis]|uniref:glutathione-specific gamma-glutamylcyclotransferase n=1 Tax=Hirsutella rhossiliensis TaxID=111463 RepID=A0A9P8MYM2_9HYPO|nr:chaC-like protein [Hirsutella rhossiliensis]KAH0963382.1 chaC-like protein [Hirsutella rhossiliensis]
MTVTTADSAPEFWLFGYGSLIWKPPPHFDERIPGWVTGYVRRFWQVRNQSPASSPATSPPQLTLSRPGMRTGSERVLQPAQWLTCEGRGHGGTLSEDHRGTPEAPGRVVTLIDKSHWHSLSDHDSSAPEKVWGVAYRIIPERITEVKDYLDIREINGYSIHYTPFHPAHGSPPITTLVYIGTPDNEQFVGPQEPHKLARHILASRGPSGLNKDYLYNLHTALTELSPDSGDAHVSDLAQRVRALERDAHDGPPRPPGPDTDFRQASSTAEAEEIEKV